MMTDRLQTRIRKAFVLSGIGLFVFATGSTRQVRADAKDDFAKLEQAMADANLAFYTALEELGAKGGGSAQRPVDGRPPILKQMDKLAERSLGTPAAAYINFETFTWSVDIEPGRLPDRFVRLVKHFPNEDTIGEIVSFLPDMFMEEKPSAKWPDALSRLAKVTESKDIRLGTLLSKGRVLALMGKPKRAKKAFGELLALKPDDDLTKIANGFVFEMDHLQIGMVAPDFETKTLDGKTVALSSFRGKALVLKFWASW